MTFEYYHIPIIIFIWIIGAWFSDLVRRRYRGETRKGEWWEFWKW